ncbi:MAG: hypothetical protein IPK26_09825 [Planctomycetes bacterium]|nr:hypothetical protein [Planctomycetota bacterium]
MLVDEEPDLMSAALSRIRWLALALIALFVLIGVLSWHDRPGDTAVPQVDMSGRDAPMPTAAATRPQSYSCRVEHYLTGALVRDAQVIWLTQGESKTLAAIEGRCELPVADGWPPGVTWMNVKAPGVAATALRVDAVPANGELIVRMRPTTTVEIAVVDAVTRAPVPGAEVWLKWSEPREGAVSVMQVSLSGKTLGDGRLGLNGAAHGEYECSCSGVGFETLVSEVAIAEGTRLLLEMKPRRPLLAGIVIDASDGTPVAGARISETSLQWRGVSGADGSFRIHSISGAPSSSVFAILSVSPPSERPDLAELAGVPPLPWNVENAVIPLQRCARFLRVVVGEEQVAEASWAEQTSRWPLPETVWRVCAPDENGLYVLPKDQDWWKRHPWLRLRLGPAGSLRFARVSDLEVASVPEGTIYTWRGVGDRDVQVAAIDSTGRGVAQARVDVLYSPWGDDSARTADLIADYDPTRWPPLFTNGVGARSTAETDSSGIARVRVPIQPAHHVRCSALGYRTEAVLVPPEGDCRVVLHRAVTIRGRIRDWSGAGGLTLVDAASSEAPLEWPAWRVELSKTGTFVAHDVPPGNYRAILSEGSGWSVIGRLEVPVVTAFETEVVFDPPVWPSRFETWMHGEDLRTGDRLFLRNFESGACLHYPIQSADGLRVRLIPGTYLVSRSRHNDVVFHESRIQVGGASAEFRLVFPTNAAAVRLTVAGRPQANQWVRIREGPSDPSIGVYCTDPDGWIRWAAAPAPQFTLVAIVSPTGSRRDGVWHWPIQATEFGGDVEGVAWPP